VTTRPPHPDPSAARATLQVGGSSYRYYDLEKLGIADLDRLPYTVKVLIENAARHAASGSGLVTPDDLAALANWRPDAEDATTELPFLPARVILQDFTGVPVVVDLAAMRDAIAGMGGDPNRINPLVPADLVIDHSVQVDQYGSDAAFLINVEREYERNGERYALLRWAQEAFANFRVVPPGTGIVHQVNLEYLADVVSARADADGTMTAFPDTLVGTDSHTTMINGLGVVGWGVGGIEAEAALLGQPLYQPLPVVVGFRLDREMRPGTTATDLVLTVTEMLRAHGVVGKFVEFHGTGLSRLGLADRATISNMSPEFGATATLFPVDDETLRYLRMTGRSDEVVARVEAYARAQHLFRTDASPEPMFNESLHLDLGSVEPSLAGPKRPQDRVSLPGLPANFRTVFADALDRSATVRLNGTTDALSSGSVLIAAITSCTNTSNPSVMVAAGLVAQRAVERGLKVPPWVKTSFAPGSKVVTQYLEAAGLMDPLKTLGFNLVGYGCTTCIGNSGPLDPAVEEAIAGKDLVVASVLSGNRNFEARVHPQVRANYLASPMLVVAFALVGRVDIDLTKEPLGTGRDGKAVFLREIWPSLEEIQATMAASLKPELFERRYASVFEGDETWKGLQVPGGSRYAWDASSTYVQEPPFFVDLPPEPAPLRDVARAGT